MPIAWTNDLSISVPLIDKQHMKLIEIINDLEEAIELGKGANVTDALFMELSEYINIHFASEEKYMIENEYPGYEGQKSQHNYFVTKVRELMTEANTEKKDISREALGFLENWLVNHIKKSDGKIGNFIKTKRST